MNSELIVFFILAGLSIISALIVITRRNPVASALFLVFNFFVLAGIYLTLNAQFLAIIQILVYAGAIMVLFVFVIMLLNLSDEEKLIERITLKKLFRIFISIVFVFQIIYILFSMSFSRQIDPFVEYGKIGTVESIGRVLFTTYLFPFEITSILLLAAIVGSVVLAKKKFP